VVAKRLNYDVIAPTYDRRYDPAWCKFGEGIVATVTRRAKEAAAGRVLEVGCGTGYWLAALQPFSCRAYGLDLSIGMLREAQQRLARSSLIRGSAVSLPFQPQTFAFIFCVNALHHFEDPCGFVAEARMCLKEGGALTVIGMNPHTGCDRWYLYNYFRGTYEADLRRYPSAEAIAGWMRSAGFDEIEFDVAHRVVHNFAGREVLSDPSLTRNGTSRLGLLSNDAYFAGLRCIEAALAAAEASGEAAIFPVDVSLASLTGRLACRVTKRAGAH
jgi:SAM-dependent methyltransferase